MSLGLGEVRCGVVRLLEPWESTLFAIFRSSFAAGNNVKPLFQFCFGKHSLLYASL